MSQSIMKRSAAPKPCELPGVSAPLYLNMAFSNILQQWLCLSLQFIRSLPLIFYGLFSAVFFPQYGSIARETDHATHYHSTLARSMGSSDPSQILNKVQIMDICVQLSQARTVTSELLCIKPVNPLQFDTKALQNGAKTPTKSLAKRIAMTLRSTQKAQTKVPESAQEINENEQKIGKTRGKSAQLQPLSSNIGNDSLPSSNGRLVYLVFPGNPGICQFYRTFLNELYDLSNGTIEVQCFSYLGHSKRCSTTGEVFSLQDQIDFASKYCETLLESDPSITLILAGHSVGAFIALKVIESGRILPERLLQTVFLMPTIHKIGDSPNGRQLSFFLAHFRPLIGALAGVLALLPRRFLLFLVRLNVGSHTKLDDVVQTVANHLISRDSALNCLFMAHQEMERIREIPRAGIERIIGKSVWLFAPGDRWTPLSYRKELQSHWPEAKMLISHSAVQHAFVVGGSEIVAAQVWTWVQEALLQL
jgi:pimeloyl-ACP methyl ester carboxylesterase